MNRAVARFTNSKPMATAARFDEPEPAKFMAPTEPAHAGPGPKIVRCRKSSIFNCVLKRGPTSLEIHMKNNRLDLPATLIGVDGNGIYLVFRKIAGFVLKFSP
jgi:hypothetical protein